MTTSPQARVQVLHVPGCPLVDQVRSLLDDCMRCAGVQPLVEIVTGPYPSPTVLINGVDVVTGLPAGNEVCCRLDLPTRHQIVMALWTAAHG